ncbi:MAG: Ig-like domain-containing protein [Methanomassiliicoccales archaeon]
MAQKKRKEPEVKEEYNFAPPDFNEREFLEKDITVTKTVLISALLAAVFGVVAYLTTDLSYVIGLLIIVIGAVALKYIFQFLPFDLSAVEFKTWLGNGAMFFFLALGIWVLLLNPPFGDTVDPQINDMEVWAGDLQIDSPYHDVLAGEITFNATVTDNGDLSKVQFSLPNHDTQKYDMSKGDDGRYEITYNFTEAGTYRFYVTAVDEAGNTQTFTAEIEII